MNDLIFPLENFSSFSKLLELQFNHLSSKYDVVLLKIVYICTQFNYNFKLQ